MLTLLAAATLFAAPSVLRLDRVQESLTGPHFHYQQYIDGVPLLDGDNTSVDVPRGAMHVRGELRFVRKTIVQERPLERFAEFRDEKSGELLRRVPLFWTAKGRVFAVNPVAQLNDPNLQDQNDSASAVPSQAYREVDVDPLLAGPNVVISDLETPTNPIIDPAQSLLFDRSQPQFEMVNAWYHIDRAQKYLQSLGYVGPRRLVDYAVPVDPHGANQTDNSYYIASATPGRGALYFGDGGTDDAEDPDIMLHEFMHVVQDWIAPGAFGGESRDQARALGEGYADYWSFSSEYMDTVSSGRDPFCIGDWDARCWLDDASQGCGYKAGSDCLRRVDSAKTMSDYLDQNQSGTEHKNGEIWSSALREIFMRLGARYGADAGRRMTDTLVIESYFDTPPSPTFRVMAQKLIDADKLLNGGANASTICSAMTLRSILTTADCDRAPRGEVTYFQSPDQNLPMPDNDATGVLALLSITDPRSINRVFVHVRASHPARGNLRITLVAPDGTTVLLKPESLDITPDLDVTYGLDAQPAQPLDVLQGKPAAGTWQLRVADVLPTDRGTFLSWSLGFEFVGDGPAVSRPVTSSEKRIIAVAGHLNGANGTRFVSDVKLFNRAGRAASVMLIYTPSGTNGNTTFAAVRAVIDPGRVVSFDDVVANELQSVGAGQLEIQGDVAQLVITSRTYTKSPAGTYGQAIPALPVSAAVSPAVINFAEVDADYRTNFGFADAGGTGGKVHVSISRADDGTIVEASDFTIEPFSHSQVSLTGVSGDFVITMTPLAGAKILAYASVVDNRTGDPIYVPAVTNTLPAHQAIAPAVNAPGANGTLWRTDVRTTAPQTILRFQSDEKPAGTAVVRDVLGSLFRVTNTSGVLVANVPANEILTTRTWTDSANGSFGQFIPFFDVNSGAKSTDVLQVEVSPAFRTNIGVMAAVAATARITETNAAGVVLATYDVSVAPLQLVQIPMTAAVINGRVHVEATAPVIVYGSLVDNRTGDPTFVSPVNPEERSDEGSTVTPR